MTSDPDFGNKLSRECANGSCRMTVHDTDSWTMTLPASNESCRNTMTHQPEVPC